MTRRALIVAHPDDEALFFGGLLLAHPGDWTVICCSRPVSDPRRIDRFPLACQALGARPILLDGPDAGINSALDLSGLPAALDGFDVLVSHGPTGEYGHPHHRQVHRHVVALTAGRPAIYHTGAHVLALNPGLALAKLAALKRYDHIAQFDNGLPKWRALLDRYGSWFDLESYDARLPDA